MTGAAHPVGALHAVRDPGAAAAFAAEALRAVNHLTLGSPSPGVPGWEEVGDLYRVLVELRLVTERLPQAVEQISRHLQRPTGGACYRSDPETRDSADTLVARAAKALDAAQAGARQAGSDLAAAQSAVADLSSVT